MRLKNKKNKKWFGRQEMIVVVLAIILTTAGIKAADKFFSEESAKEKNSCPAGMVNVPSIQGGFCIDKFEVSPGEKCNYPNPLNQLQTRENLDNFDCHGQTEIGKIPWTNISQNQAAEVCAKLGKRLPSGAEWLQAALATPDKESDWGADDCQVNSNWSQQPGLTGNGKNCVSGVGAYDMIGNVWEWVSENVKEGKYKESILPKEGYISSVANDSMPNITLPDKSDPNYHDDYFWVKQKGLRAVARGGFWNNQKEGGQYSVYIVAEPATAGTGIGFRCAK